MSCYCFVIIVTTIFLPNRLVDSFTNNVIRVFIKGSDYKFSENMECCGFNLSKIEEEESLISKESLLTFTSYNYITSLEIILDIIIDKNFQRIFNQSRPMLKGMIIDKESTTLIADAIAPYENIMLFDTNSNNNELSVKTQYHYLVFYFRGLYPTTLLEIFE